MHSQQLWLPTQDLLNNIKPFFKKASMEEGRSLEMPPADKLFVVDSLLEERKSLFSGDVATHGLPMPLHVTPLLCVCRER